MLVFLPIGDEVARLPQEWFLNTPVLWLGALVLIGLVRGPLRNAPALLKKPLKFAAASCVALGLMILVTWRPVLQLSKSNSGFSMLWFVLMGLSTAGWLASFFWIFLARPQRRTGAVPVAIGGPVQRAAPKPVEVVRNVPAERFADVGGMEEAKEQIREVVQGHLNPEKYERYQADLGWKKPLVVMAVLLLVVGQFVAAQNLGNAPQFNVAVQGETGAQPEGTFLNFINWIGNVIAPVGAGGAVLGAVVSWLTGRGTRSTTLACWKSPPRAGPSSRQSRPA